MGSSKSKPEVDNTGLANGNIINNGNIEFEKQVSGELKYIEIAMYVSVIVKIVHVVIVLLKMYTKKVKKSQEKKQQLEQIVIDNLKRS